MLARSTFLLAENGRIRKRMPAVAGNVAVRSVDF